MLSVALRTLRARWITLVGSFLALSLGVGLIATMGLGLAATLDAPQRQPERFARAPVVVKGADTLRVTTPAGEHTAALAHPRGVDPALTRRLAALGPVAEDRSFPVRVRGRSRQPVGHPWAVAAFAPYTLDAGRAPRSDSEVVTTGWAPPGERLTTDSGTLTVVGTVRQLGFEDALFYTDVRAARLSLAVPQVVVTADPAAVRAAVKAFADRDGPGGATAADGVDVRVLTGRDRRLADPDPERDREALLAVNAALGTAGGITGFASTFAFAVAQRRREFALLRTTGATPGQIRRMVLVEALLLGVTASAAGCVLGAYGAPILARAMVDGALHPAGSASGAPPGPTTWPSGPVCSSPSAGSSPPPGAPAASAPPRRCARPPRRPGP